MEQLENILKQYWGYDQFRPMQKEIALSVLSGKDTLAILPTGGGKSLCFQVPALAGDGLCLVISPLVALMKDQVDNLKKKDIPALLIHSGMKRRDVIRILQNATEDYFRFLYLSPERLETSLFKEYLPALNIRLIAVDEAHCISQWGYDFRPSYLKIAQLRESLPDVPVLALTASATPIVQKDIADKLSMDNPALFRQSYERKNLSYSVFQADSKLARLTEIVSKVPGSGIVYCKSRKRTVEIAQLLEMHGISAGSYHAGLDGETRSQRQKAWMEGRIRIMACTNAFGMGIDKPDVRLVIHADIPDSLESYYQEAGRAGRDGKKSYAVLLYDTQDISELKALPDQRYPDIEQIKIVYTHLVNFLQIPSWSGENQSFVFKIENFSRVTGMKANHILACLKALESDEWFDFNEKSFAPPTVEFTTSKSQLYDFYREHPVHELLLVTLLRTYGGIFDFPVAISEKLIAELLKKEENEIREQLKKITAFGVIRYSPQSDEPQIIFRKQRVPSSDFTFNAAPYRKRKENYENRVRHMIAFATSAECRSRLINQYFGDEGAGDCGICDNCLSRKSKDLSSEEFQEYAAIITNVLQDSPMKADQLLSKTKQLNQEKFWKVLLFLQSENRVIADHMGTLHCPEKC